jgi:hypothetical protein
MLIAVRAVKAKLNSYMGRHRLTVEYWSLSTPDKDLPRFSASHPWERLKNRAFT